MSHLRLVHSAASAIPAPRWRFTSRDLMVLSDYMYCADAHGYCKAIIEPGCGADRPEDGGYALLYRPGQPWAQWGLARSDGDIVVWRCSTGVDLGRHRTMQSALESLPSVAVPEPRECESIQGARVAFC